MDWTEVCKTATKFLPFLENFFDPLVEEMRGIAEGASVDFESILALNVRTEIAYGMFNDGCTAFSWKTPDSSFLAQNWDVGRGVTYLSSLNSIDIFHSGNTNRSRISFLSTSHSHCNLPFT